MIGRWLCRHRLHRWKDTGRFVPFPSMPYKILQCRRECEAIAIKVWW